MRSIALHAVLMGIFCSVVTSVTFADTLIYNNSNYGGVFTPGNNVEIFDYGTCTGGLASKFTFGYSSTSVIPTVTVRFYQNIGINYYDPGYLTKAITLRNLPSTGGAVQYYTCVLPEADRFMAPTGQFGYSIALASSTAKLALASGGTDNADVLWEYIYDIYGWDWYPFGFSNTWAGLYMKLYKGPPINEITCNISGYKFNDSNGNGVWNAGEPALPGWELYLDTNSNGTHEVSEPNAVTDPNGFYLFKNMASPATYRIREIMKNGWTQTLPGSAASYQYAVATDPNHTYGPYNFGNTTNIAKYGGGFGTVSQPYQICTLAHMNQIGLDQNDWNKQFILMADLDMSGITGTQYNIIGSTSCYFTGSFNGNDHVIRNFSYTTTATKNYIGLFGYAQNAQISNLGLENVTLSTGAESLYVGGLVGYQSSGSIQQCYVTGSVSGTTNGQYFGGLAGYLNGTTATNCRSDVHVFIIGAGGKYIGGFAGRAPNLTNCYSVGAVTAGTGGLYVGGLVGFSGTGTIVSSYWDTQTSGQPTSGGGTPKTTEQMRTSSTFTGWNFTSIWRICNTTNTPRLQWEPLAVGDFGCPEGVELYDLLTLSDAWLMTGVSVADIAPEGVPDGKVNLLDYALLAENWLVGVD